MNFVNKREAQIIWFSLKDTAIISALGIAIFLTLRWTFPISQVHSKSMEPTLEAGDRILVNNVLFHFSDPERGDIVVLDSGFRFGFFNEKVLFIKRVIGLPGDIVEVSEEGHVYINSHPLQEDYASKSNTPYFPITVPEGHYFLMGDNRDHSFDSRTMGPVGRQNIIGKLEAVAWPVKKITLFH